MGATEGFMRAQIEQLEQENKTLKEKLSEITMVADDEKQSIEHILELEEENKKLKEDNRFLTKISKEYMEKENIIEVTEFTQLYKDDLEKENKKLNEYNRRLKQGNDDLKEQNRKLKELVNEIHRDKEHILGEKLILQEENENLKSDLAYERTMLDNVGAEYKSSQNVIKKLEEELKKYKKLHKYSNGELLTYKGGELMEEDTLQELRDLGEI